MKPQIPARVSRQRAAELTALALKQKTEYVRNCTGKTLSAVVEKRHPDEIRAVTENFIHVLVTEGIDGISPESLGGKEITLQITDVLTQVDSPDVSSII